MPFLHFSLNNFIILQKKDDINRNYAVLQILLLNISILLRPQTFHRISQSRPNCLITHR